MKIGIEAIAFHAPEHYIEIEELAKARRVDPEKFTKGLGQKKMAVATPLEDTVTLAVNAGMKALKNFNINPKEIGTLVVGTETGVDHSKPVATYVHKALGLRSNCTAYETKHACFGAMAGVTSAVDWIASGRAAGSKALIIASDIAKYSIGDPGEPTQGAGSVAMVISDKPNLIYFDPAISGDYTKHVMDFWRPLYSTVAFVDGHYSIQCYLDALSGAFSDAMNKVSMPQSYRIEELQACLYHSPFAKMTSKAHHRHWEADLGKEIHKESLSYDDVKESCSLRVSPWLSLNSVVGNIYTGSLFLSLIDFLRKSPNSNPKPISLFSYGSGCAATFCIAYPMPGHDRFQTQLDPEPELDTRRKLEISEYERITQMAEKITANGSGHLDPEEWGLTSQYLFLGTKDHIREYSGI